MPGRANWRAYAEVSVKLSAVGQALPGDGPQIATDNARRICEAAKDVGTTVTLDMEDHTTTDLTLSTLCRAARRLSQHRGGLAGVPASHRGGLSRPGTCGLTRAVVQGRLQRAKSVAYQDGAKSTCPMCAA